MTSMPGTSPPPDSAASGEPLAPAAIRRRFVALPFAALLAGTASRAHAASIPAEPLAAMREGGCVLLLRHARTDPGVGDPPGFRLDACATQRNLSAEGRAQAQRLGAAMRSAGVALGPVRSSRWCRCLDTARLAFERVEPWPALDSFFDDRSDEPTRTAAVRAWALAFRGPGNAVLVTHQVNATALVGGWLEMGEVRVLRARAGELSTLGRFAV